MSYHTKRRRPALSGWNPFPALTAVLTGATPPAPAAPIEMPDDFVGNATTLPLCPQTDGNGWCRKAAGQPPVKMAVNTMPTTSAYQGSAITDFFSSLVGSLNVTPPGAAAVAPAASGMSTTTKLVIAGGAVALIAVIASRK